MLAIGGAEFWCILKAFVNSMLACLQKFADSKPVSCRINLCAFERRCPPYFDGTKLIDLRPNEAQHDVVDRLSIAEP